MYQAKKGRPTYASKVGTMYVPIHQIPTQVCSAVERKTRRQEDIKMTQRRHKPIAMPRRKQYDETGDAAATRRHGTDDTKTTDNDSKNNFRSEEVFPRPRNLSIDFVPDLTPYSYSWITAVKWDAYDMWKIQQAKHEDATRAVWVHPPLPAYRDSGWKNRDLKNRFSPPSHTEHIENFTKDLKTRRDIGNRASPVNRASGPGSCEEALKSMVRVIEGKFI